MNSPDSLFNPGESIQATHQPFYILTVAGLVTIALENAQYKPGDIFEGTAVIIKSQDFTIENHWPRLAEIIRPENIPEI